MSFPGAFPKESFIDKSRGLFGFCFIEFRIITDIEFMSDGFDFGNRMNNDSPLFRYSFSAFDFYRLGFHGHDVLLINSFTFDFQVEGYATHSWDNMRAPARG